MNTNETDCLLDRSEVEQRFGIPKRFLELAATRGEGPKLVRIGRLVRYRVTDIRAWIEQNVSGQVT
ncbi:helix-turn-helix transcriptional regulator [Roseobacter sp. EG26]|uniref:helix-turn-helix transcriptional regulator n=1 Tax=Roseobacter sp. EG26 TaxID=3412477 RepID=UPI003CE51480